jgi:hypothetical protein
MTHFETLRPVPSLPRSVRFPGLAAMSLLFSLCLLLAALPQVGFGQEEAKAQFRVSYASSAHAGPVTGRVFVMISDTNDREPRLQIGRDGTPFFGRDVEGLAPGEFGLIDRTDMGSPVESISELPAGDYFVQGMVNIYTEFHRADGHVVWMHNDQWEGQAFQRSPGNLYSDVVRVHLDPAEGFDIRLEATNVIPPIPFPEDSEWVKRFRFESPTLTEFWGEPIYIGATVLLPRDYEGGTISYPVLYKQGHFSSGDPLRFRAGSQIYEEWIKDDFPRMMVVTFQHPTPYFDDSYAVNSVNVGPYGDAIIEELIPEVESASGPSPNPGPDGWTEAQQAVGSPWPFRFSTRTFLGAFGPTARTR